jgi:hypothetical protein
MTQPRTIVDEAGRIRALRVDPWAREVRAFTLPAAVQPCGCCWDVCGIALSDQLGRHQQGYLVFGGAEMLVVGVGVVAPTWRWGDLQCCGLGLVLGIEGRAFEDSRMLPGDALGCLTWTARRRATAAVA